MLSWPKAARAAIALLFRPLQDLDIFVEDTGDEVFYTELFRRAAPNGVNITRVIALGNRDEVCKAATKHDFKDRKALFLIDGDLEWVRGDAPPNAKVYRLDCYCIENLLICGRAGQQLLMEDLAIAEPKAEQKLGFDSWIGEMNPLVNLFVSFAVLSSIDPTQPTVSLGIGSVIENGSAGSCPAVDAPKTDILREALDQKSEALLGLEEFRRRVETITNRVLTLERPVDVVSGKDFLLPLYRIRLIHCDANKPTLKALRMRLARHVDPNRLEALRRAVNWAAQLT